MAKLWVILAILLLIFATGIKNVSSKRQKTRAGYHIDNLKDVVGKRYFRDDENDNDVDNVGAWTWVNSKRRRHANGPQNKYKEMQKNIMFGRAAERRDSGHRNLGTSYVRKMVDGIDKKRTFNERPVKTTDETTKNRRQKDRGRLRGMFQHRTSKWTNRPNKMERKGRKHLKEKWNRHTEKKIIKKKRKEKGKRRFEKKFLNQTPFKQRKISNGAKHVNDSRNEAKSIHRNVKKKTKGKITTVKPKPIKKSQMVNIVLGNGLKAAAQRGNCLISYTLPINDGNAFVISGTNVLEGSNCNYNIKASSGSTVTVDCPVFNLYSKGCSKESIILTNAGKTTKYCGNKGPVNWVSSAEKVHILHRRTKTKKSKIRTGKNSNCSYSFVCKVSITGSSGKDKLVGFDSDCNQTFNMASGESAVVFSINGPKKRDCIHNFKGPQGTLFNISCPFVDLGGTSYCDDSLIITDTGAQTTDTLCKGYKSLSLKTTLTHMVQFHHKRAKSKTGCSGGYFCKITVIGNVILSVFANERVGRTHYLS